MPPQTMGLLMGTRSFERCVPSTPSAVELWGLLAALAAREPGLVELVVAMTRGTETAARTRAATLLLVTLRPWPVVAKDIAGPVWQPLRLMVPVVMRADEREMLLAVLPSAAAAAVSPTAVPRWLKPERLVEVRDHGLLVAAVSIEFSDSVADADGGIIATTGGVAPFTPATLRLPAADIFRVALWWG